MNLKFTSTGFDELKLWLSTVAQGVKEKATAAFAEYIVGDQSHGLKHYSPYQYVSYQRAYGGFKSDKQRRYVMAMIRAGNIDPGYPHRTGNFQRNWTYKASGAGRYTIQNSTNYGGYLVSDTEQANLPRLAGWRKVQDVIAANFAGAIRHAQAVVNQFLKSK